jgi:futalosine hydrolase
VRILVVTATDAEVSRLVAGLEPLPGPSPRLRAYRRHAHAVDVLTTGAGMVATAMWCSGLFARERYDLALNAGVCGSFRAALIPGAVVHVTSDCIADLGAEDGDAFLTVHDLKLVGEDEFPYRGGRIVNVAPPRNTALAALEQVTGITVNTVHGNAATIARAVERLDPDIESMEGAAFMSSCLLHGVPFAQVRAVSNVVERRNRAAWKLGDAIGALGEEMLRIIEDAGHT